jgi:hypothetical protein
MKSAIGTGRALEDRRRELAGARARYWVAVGVQTAGMCGSAETTATQCARRAGARLAPKCLSHGRGGRRCAGVAGVADGLRGAADRGQRRGGAERGAGECDL